MYSIHNIDIINKDKQLNTFKKRHRNNKFGKCCILAYNEVQISVTSNYHCYRFFYAEDTRIKLRRNLFYTP